MDKSINQVLQQKSSFEDQVKHKNLSIRKCALCNADVAIRDVRQYPVLCYLHTQYSNAIKRYTSSFAHGTLTDSEKQRILSDKTRRVGPFNYGKK